MTTSRRGDRDDLRRAWTIAGSLLIASVVIGSLLLSGIASFPGRGFIERGLFSAALVLFAFGIRWVGSVTARRPLGTAALVGLAVWNLAPSLANILLPSDARTSNNADLSASQMFGYIDLVVQLILAIVAVTQIARAGTIPSPWSWAPGWVVLALSVSRMLQVAMSASARDSETALGMLFIMDSMLRIGGAVFLGVLAIVLANRARGPRRVPVLSSAE